MISVRAAGIFYALASALTVPTLAVAQVDALPIETARIVNSPADVAGWEKTIAIRAVQVDPSFGVRIETTGPIPDRWNAHVKGWGDAGDNAVCGQVKGDDGCIQFTVWTFGKVAGQWTGSGFIQMWKWRDATGAFETSGGWTTEFPKNWAYDARWGALAGYVPRPGDQLGFMVTAGDARGRGDVHSVRERSNVVIVPATAGAWQFAGSTEPRPPIPDPVPVPGGSSSPAPTPTASNTSSADVDALLAIIAEHDKNDADRARESYDQAERMFANLVDRLNALAAQVDTLQSRPVPASSPSLPSIPDVVKDAKGGNIWMTLAKYGGAAVGGIIATQVK